MARKETVIGVSTSSLRELPLEKRFEVAQREGFGLVEINLNYDPLETVIPLKNFLKNLEIELAVHSGHDKMEFDGASPEVIERSLKQMEEEMAFAEEIGASYYIFHVTKSGELENILRELRGVLSRDIPSIYENSGVGNGASEVEIERVLDYLGVDMNLDVGHLWRAMNNGSVKIGLPEFLRKFRSRIVYVHLHDNDGIHDNHWAIGKGSVPVEEILEKLNKKIPLVIETRGSLEDVKISKEILKKLIG